MLLALFYSTLDESIHYCLSLLRLCNFQYNCVCQNLSRVQTLKQTSSTMGGDTTSLPNGVHQTVQRCSSNSWYNTDCNLIGPYGLIGINVMEQKTHTQHTHSLFTVIYLSTNPSLASIVTPQPNIPNLLPTYSILHSYMYITRMLLLGCF